MPNETLDSCDDLVDAQTPATAGASGFARIVDAMLVAAPAPARKRSPARKAAAADEDPAQDTPAAALERAQALIRGGQVDAGLTLCHRVWPVVADAGDVLQMGICQAAMLIGYHYKGMCRAAVAAGRHGLALMDRTGDQARKLHLMSHLAVNLARVGHLTEAFETLYRGAQLLPTVEADPLTQCRFWSNAAATYGFLDLNEDALACSRRGAALAELIDDPAMVSTARGNTVIAKLAVLKDRRASWEELEPVHRELLAQVDAVVAQGRRQLVLAMAVTGADALMSVKRWDEARALLLVGRSETQAAGMGPMVAHIERRLSAVERQTGHLRLASVYAREAVALSALQEDPELRAEAYLESSLVDEAQGHWQHALVAYRNYAREREAWNAAQATSRWRTLAHRLNEEREQWPDRPAAPWEPAAGGAGDDPAATSGAEAFARESFEQRLERWREKPSAPGPLVVMVGGIDELVALRARFSRDPVAEATRHLGRLLRRHLRPGDLLTVWQADEQYAVAFRLGTSLESALEFAHRLCQLAAQEDWDDVAPGADISASFGLAVFGASEDLETALLRADWALHDVRGDGRGRARAIW